MMRLFFYTKTHGSTWTSTDLQGHTQTKAIEILTVFVKAKPGYVFVCL